MRRIKQMEAYTVRVFHLVGTRQILAASVQTSLYRFHILALYPFLMKWFEKKGDFQELFLEHLIIPFAWTSSGVHWSWASTASDVFLSSDLTVKFSEGMTVSLSRVFEAQYRTEQFSTVYISCSLHKSNFLICKCQISMRRPHCSFLNNFQCWSLVSPFPSSFQHKTNIFPEAARSLPQTLILPVMGIR